MINTTVPEDWDYSQDNEGLTVSVVSIAFQWSWILSSIWQSCSIVPAVALRATKGLWRQNSRGGCVLGDQREQRVRGSARKWRSEAQQGVSRAGAAERVPQAPWLGSQDPGAEPETRSRLWRSPHPVLFKLLDQPLALGPWGTLGEAGERKSERPLISPVSPNAVRFLKHLCCMWEFCLRNMFCCWSLKKVWNHWVKTTAERTDSSVVSSSLFRWESEELGTLEITQWLTVDPSFSGSWCASGL